MTKRIIRCMGWPIGLKLVFFWVVLDAIVGTFQFLYWAKVTHEFYPNLTLQGTYAFVAYAAVLLGLIFAMLFRRQVFVGITLAVAVVHMFVTLHWNAQIACDLLREHCLTGNLGDYWIEHYTLYMGWNAFTFLAWALVFWYVMRYEVTIRKDETSMPNQVPEDTARKLADPQH